MAEKKLRKKNFDGGGGSGGCGCKLREVKARPNKQKQMTCLCSLSTRLPLSFFSSCLLACLVLLNVLCCWSLQTCTVGNRNAPVMVAVEEKSENNIWLSIVNSRRKRKKKEH